MLLMLSTLSINKQGLYEKGSGVRDRGSDSLRRLFSWEVVSLRLMSYYSSSGFDPIPNPFPWPGEGALLTVLGEAAGIKCLLPPPNPHLERPAATLT